MAQRLGPLLVIAILLAPLGASGGASTEPDHAVRDLPLTTEGGERVLSAVDAVHIARLKASFVARVWRTVAQVGQDRADAAWLLAQPTDM